MRGIRLSGLLLALFLPFLWVQSAEAQGTDEGWFDLPKGTSGLLIVVNVQGIYQFTIRGADDKIIKREKWPDDLPFVKRYQLPAGDHEISVPGIIKNILVSTSENAVTTLEIERYQPAEGEFGVSITAWRGPPPIEISGIVSLLQQRGLEDLAVVEASEAPLREIQIEFDTEPPWPMPPRPKR